MQVVPRDQGKIYPFEPLNIIFTNPINVEEFDAEQDVVVEPSIEGLQVCASPNHYYNKDGDLCDDECLVIVSTNHTHTHTHTLSLSLSLSLSPSLCMRF
jgi:hypothetical protein